MSVSPRSTYRVQLHSGFTLDDAAAIVEYLADLGISHLYCSPYLQAAPGSTHGYDVVDPQRVNDALGGAEARARLSQALMQMGMGQVLDIVPNHMAINDKNPWWWNVLENGVSSPYAAYFDVDWAPPEARHSNEVLVPVLGDHYGRVLEAGEIRLHYEAGRFTIQYHENIYPVEPRSLSGLLSTAAMRSNSDELFFLARAAETLPEPPAADRVNTRRRQQDQAVLQVLLARLVGENPAIGQVLNTVVEEMNADPDSLDVLLQLQNYRLAYWRMAARELGYRRFFDINSLIGIRMEDEQVFSDTHALVLGWVEGGLLDGLRIDHPDGLRDPEGYFRRLADSHPGTWILLEKILESGERLPEDWPVAGTTGYDFMNRVNGLFVDPGGEAPLTDFYARFTGRSTDYRSLVHEKKLEVMNDLLGSDVNRLTFLLVQICERHRRHRDYTQNELREAICETAACLPIYRTYVRAEANQVHETDIHYVEGAIQAAKTNRESLDPQLFDFLHDLLLLKIHGDLEGEFVMRFQQFTGPAMAKGVEDTVFYNFCRLISLNEVGGSPGEFGLGVEEFHRACIETQRHWPWSMLATSTHDTKRSEDVRARINLLSEIPERWFEAVQRWAAINERYRAGEGPDRNDEYLFYQTLVGAWPLEEERALRYMEKVSREAKIHTSWTNPNPAYEEATANFVKAALRDEAFRSDLEDFVSELIIPGRINSLAQTLIKLTAPGVPDIYQGTEIWNYSLVDPDNRRRVDYTRLRSLLNDLNDCPEPEEIWGRADEGLPKLWVIHQVLAVRQRHPNWFGPDAGYDPIIGQGEHAVAYRRGQAAIVIVPRLILKLKESGDESRIQIPPGNWRNELTQERIQGGSYLVSHLLARFPVCFLVEDSG